jgi:hypothetical protein
MKEHAFFLQLGFTPRDSKYTARADELRIEFDDILSDTIVFSNGIVGRDILQSGEVITQYTLEAEKLSSFYTGIKIATKLTEAAAGLAGGTAPINQTLEQRVVTLDRRAVALLDDIIQFKCDILADVLACKMFTVNYPLLLEHIIREAKLYQKLIIRLLRREVIQIQREMFEQEYFWNRIMAEHAKFIRGLLDPSEEELIKTANDFGKQFDGLTEAAKEAMDMNIPKRNQLIEDSLEATKNIRDFKAQGTAGILECKVKSIIIPLLGDHTLREANHYLRLLKIYHHI